MCNEIDKIFDEEFIQSVPEQSGLYNVPNVIMLCRFQHQYREKIEQFYQYLPKEKKKDIYSRIRKLDDRWSLSALYELVVHEYLRYKGLSPQCNPIINGQTPEYSISLSSIGEAIVEVATVFEPPDTAKLQQTVNYLLNRLNELSIPYIFSIHLDSAPTKRLEFGKISKHVQHQLKMTPNCDLTISLVNYGLNAQLKAKYVPNRTKSAVITSTIETGNPAFSTMENALKDKSIKYNNLGCAYIIAIGMTDLNPMNEITLNTILYGNEQFTQDLTSNQISLERDLSGMFTGAKKSSHEHVSAVLYWEREATGHGNIKDTIKLFHNPETKYKLPSESFGDIPQLLHPDLEWIMPNNYREMATWKYIKTLVD